MAELNPDTSETMTMLEFSDGHVMSILAHVVYPLQQLVGESSGQMTPQLYEKITKDLSSLSDTIEKFCAE